MSKERKNALSGVRIIECSVHLNGPFAGKLLAQLGAEVIKVEPPYGEPVRHSNPFVGGESRHLLNYNTNKKFITLNLKDPRGKDIFLELISKADVFIENFRPGVMDRLGLGYEVQKKTNPTIIYASSTGYGIEGPYRDEAAYDTLIQAMCGMMDSNGFEDSPPIRTAPAVMDISAGTFCALSILAALYYRKNTGIGQRIDMAMYDVAINYMVGLYSFLQEGVLRKTGNFVPVLAPYNVYKAKNGYLAIIIGEDSRWNAFLESIGQSDLINDDRFNSIEKRVNNYKEVDKLVSNWLTDKTVEEASNVVRDTGGAAGPVRPLSSILDDPQVRARNLLVDVPHPTLGKVQTIGTAFKMSETPGVVETPGLPLGYNNKQVYSELLGFDDGKLNALRQDNVI